MVLRGFKIVEGIARTIGQLDKNHLSRFSADYSLFTRDLTSQSRTTHDFTSSSRSMPLTNRIFKGDGS